MPTYLETHPPKVRQFRQPRRAKVSGLIVVHTAESILDQIGEDSGAEDVARFIAGRSDYGSYHTLVDSDSRVRLVPFDAEAYGDRTGSNYFAIHISFACKAAGWSGMSPERKAAMIRHGGIAAAEAAKWLKDNHGIEVPPARVSRVESERREPGFISHAQRDPGRRSDPGADFPWAQFMREYVTASEALDKADRTAARHASLTTKITKAVAEKARLSRLLAKWRGKRKAL